MAGDTTDPVLTFRDFILKAVPRWLQLGNAAKVLYAIGLHADVIGDAAVKGVRRRFVGLPEASDALGLAGRMRRIRRGRNEPDAAYAVRLQRWLDDHRNRGGPYALIRQVFDYSKSSLPAVPNALIYESGVTFGIADGGAAGAVITRLPQAAPFDTDTASWARWFLTYLWPTAIASDGIWSDAGNWDDGGVWDSGLDALTVQDLRIVPSEWNAAHAKGFIVLQAASAELWDSPAGTWADPGVWGGGDDVIKIAVE